MTRNSSSAAIVVRELHKSYGTIPVLTNVDVEVERGTVFALLGPNGAGKTTIVHILSTLIAADSGDVFVDGYNVRSHADDARAAIGLTGQFSAVDNLLTGEENLLLMARLRHLGARASKSRVAELLEQFDLVESARKPLATYSGGMKRRLDLAMTLVSTPRVIFLDEPTTGLDPRTRSQMWDTIRRLVSTGSTVLLTTQYLDEADQLADRIAVIDTGRVVAEGTADELKASVGQSSLQLRLLDPADRDEAVRAIRSVLGVDVTLSPEAARITAPMQDPDRITDLLVSLRAQNISLTELSVQKPTLDEVFLTLTGHGVEAAAGTETDADTRPDASETPKGRVNA